MTNFEEPIMAPEGKGEKGRYESADLDIRELESFLEDTRFENMEALKDTLTGRYNMSARQSLGNIEAGMTREITAAELAKEVKRATSLFKNPFKKDLNWSDISTPLSGEEPAEVLSTDMQTTHDGQINVKIYEVRNRNQTLRYEYILTPAR